MDRIDIHLHVPPVPFKSLDCEVRGASSEQVRQRVRQARLVQGQRFEGIPGVHANGHMRPMDIRRWCRPSSAVARMLQQAVDRTGLSARAYHRVLRVARTIADLAGATAIASPHIAEALSLRRLDR